MKRVHQLLMMSFFILGAFTAAHAASYYVDSVSGSDSNSGTSSGAPWRSLSKVNSTAFAPGDTINFKAGSSYSGTLVANRSGTSAAPITYQSYGSGAKPVITASGAKWSSSIQVSGSYVTVQGFLLQNGHQAGIRIMNTASHAVIKDNEITSAGSGVWISGPNNLITQNYAHDLRMIQNANNSGDYGAVGFWLDGASNNEISYNTCIRCRAASLQYGQDGGVVEIYGSANNAHIHHNWGEDSAGFIETGGGVNSDNVTLAYNVSYNNLDDFICFNSVLSNLKIYNNTIVHYAKNWNIINSCGGSLSNAVFQNNIVDSNQRMSNTTNFTHQNNLYGPSVRMTYGLGSGEKQANPLFANASAADFDLQSGSPAIDAGLNLGYTSDFEGSTVPQGAAPDMGAYEAGSGTTGTITVDDSVQGTGQNQFSYIGNWGHATGTADYNQTSSYSNTTNAYVTFAFSGTQLKFYSVKARHHGIGAVSIDGGAETNIDMYSPTRASDVLMWTSPVLPAGNHTFKLRVTGLKNPSSTDIYVVVDRVDVVTR